MRLNDNYIFRTIGDVSVLLPVDCDSEEQRGLACYNKTAAFIARCLEEETTEEAIVAALEERFEGKHEDIVRAVSDFVSTLRSAGALTEEA